MARSCGLRYSSSDRLLAIRRRKLLRKRHRRRLRIPDSLRELVKNKPLFPGLELARDGWELLDIVEQKPAEALEVVQSSRANSR